MDSICVVSDGWPRYRCYTSSAGLVEISDELALSVTPNVPFKCRIALQLETDFNTNPGGRSKAIVATRMLFSGDLRDLLSVGANVVTRDLGRRSRG